MIGQGQTRCWISHLLGRRPVLFWLENKMEEWTSSLASPPIALEQDAYLPLCKDSGALLQAHWNQIRASSCLCLRDAKKNRWLRPGSWQLPTHHTLKTPKPWEWHFRSESSSCCFSLESKVWKHDNVQFFCEVKSSWLCFPLLITWQKPRPGWFQHLPSPCLHPIASWGGGGVKRWGAGSHS